MSSTLVRVKVIVVGDVGVGKTAIGVRAARGTFEDNYVPTIGASFVQKIVEFGDKSIIFQIWDTAGQERFRSLVPMYLRDSKVALLVYDITDRASFLNVSSWLEELNRNAPQDIQKVLIGNKDDLNTQRQINKQIIAQMKDQASVNCDTVTQLITDSIATAPVTVRAALGEKDSVKRTLRRERAKHLPQSPKSQDIIRLSC